MNEDQETQLREIRDARISKKSRRHYQSSSCKFITWLYREGKHEFLSEHLLTVLNAAEALGSDALRQAIFEVLESKTNPPLVFEKLTSDIFLTWIFGLRTFKGQKPGTSALASHRAALFNLFADFRITMSLVLSRDMATSFKGLKKTKALEIAQGLSSIKIGKDPLSFSSYRWLANCFFPV